MAEYNGILRFSDEAVASVSWNDQQHTGEAGVTDEKTGTVYPFGGGGGGQDMYHVVVNSVPVTDQSISANYSMNDDGCYTSLPLDDSGLPNPYFGKDLDNGLNDAHFDFLVYADNAEPTISTTELEGITPSVTGNIQLVSDEGWHFHVTGDGTITFTAE